jgi:DDE superfamily endonuclease
MLPLQDAIIRVLPPFAPRFSHRVWVHAQLLILGAMLSPVPRTALTSLRHIGLITKHHFIHDRRVLNRAIWLARHESQILSGSLITLLVPRRRHTIVLGVDDTVERHSGRKITAKGCCRETVRSLKAYVIHCLGLKGVSMMLWVPVPWAQHVYAGRPPGITFRPAALRLARSQTLEAKAPVKLAVLGELR